LAACSTACHALADVPAFRQRALRRAAVRLDAQRNFMTHLQRWLAAVPIASCHLAQAHDPGEHALAFGQHSDPNEASVESGHTGELIWRFTRAGAVAFACLQPGHCDAGMKGQIVVGQGAL
jgi:uncharacterized membrane protein YccC